MWQISFRFRQFHLCRFGRCQACDFAPQSSYWHGELLSFFDLQSLKADFATMLVLREILLQADDVVNVSRFNDDAVIRRISVLFSKGMVRLCRKGQSDLRGDRISGPDRSAAQRAANALQNTLGAISIFGTKIRVIPSSAWGSFRGLEGFQVIPTNEARALLSQHVAESTSSKAAHDALADVLSMLSDDPLRPLAGALVVVGSKRSIPDRPMSLEPVTTPARIMKEMAERRLGVQGQENAGKQKVHWIEIQVVGNDGVGIPDQDYLIVAPDKTEHTGRTDMLGVARVDNIPAGQCLVSFPKLDKSAWHRA